MPSLHHLHSSSSLSIDIIPSYIHPMKFFGFNAPHSVYIHSKKKKKNAMWSVVLLLLLHTLKSTVSSSIESEFNNVLFRRDKYKDFSAVSNLSSLNQFVQNSSCQFMSVHCGTSTLLTIVTLRNITHISSASCQA